MTVEIVQAEMKKLQTELDALRSDKELATKRVAEHKAVLTDLLQQERVLTTLEQIGVDTSGIKVSNGKIVQTAPQ